MLHHLDESTTAERVQAGIEAVYAEGKTLTKMSAATAERRRLQMQLWQRWNRLLGFTALEMAMKRVGLLLMVAAVFAVQGWQVERTGGRTHLCGGCEAFSAPWLRA